MRCSCLSAAILAWFACLSWTAGLAAQTPEAPQAAVGDALRIEKLSPPGEVPDGQVVISPDGQRWAYPTNRGSRLVMVVDGRDVGPYDEFEPLPLEGPKVSAGPPAIAAFTPDSERLVFLGRKGGEVHVVLVGRDGAQQWPGLHRQGKRISHVLLPPAGHRVAVLHAITITDSFGRSQSGMRLVLDGHNGPDFRYINDRSLTWSAGGRHFSYLGSRESGSKLDSKEVTHMVIDTTPGPAYDRIQTGVGRFNYMIEADGGARALFCLDPAVQDAGIAVLQRLDGSAQPTDVKIHAKTIILSADGKHFAGCYGFDSDKQDKRTGTAVYHDGREIGHHQTRVISDLTISPDGSRVAYTVHGENAGKQRPHIDGKAGQDYERVGKYTFSPDGRRLAYVAKNDAGTFLVLDGTEHGPCENVELIRFSPDSRQAAWTAHVDAYNTRAFVEGRASPDIREGISWMDFSPADGQIVFMSGRVNQLGLLENGRVYFGLSGEQAFEAATVPQRTADGKHLAFVGRHWDDSNAARKPGAKEPPFLVIDGRRAPLLDRVFEPRLTFDPSGRFVAGSGHPRDLSRQRPTGFSINGSPIESITGLVAPTIEGGRATVIGVTNDQQLVRISVDMQRYVEYARSTGAATAAASGAADAAAKAEADRNYKALFLASQTSKPQVPAAALDGALYGAASGGTHQQGFIYRMNPDGSDTKPIHEFFSRDGIPPTPTSMLASSDGWLYSTTTPGVIRIRPDGSGLETVHEQKGDAARLLAAGKDGSVFGIIGGFPATPDAAPIGGIFRLTADGKFSIITPDAPDGALGQADKAKAAGDGPPAGPFGPFVSGGDGFLYGVAELGLYRITEDGSGLQWVHRFAGPPNDGVTDPQNWAASAPVILDDGTLVGVLPLGGNKGGGVLYRARKDGSDYQVIHLDRAGPNAKPNALPRIQPPLAAHGQTVYALADVTQPRGWVVLRVVGDRIEALHPIQDVNFTGGTILALAASADGSALCGFWLSGDQKDRVVFRTVVAEPAQAPPSAEPERPTLTRSETPFEAREAWPVQAVQFAAFSGTMPGVTKTSSRRGEQDTSGIHHKQVPSQASSGKQKQQQKESKEQAQEQPKQEEERDVIDEQLKKAEEGKRKANRLKNIFGR